MPLWLCVLNLEFVVITDANKRYLFRLCTFFPFLSSRYFVTQAAFWIRKILEAVKHTKPGFITYVCRRTPALNVCHFMPLSRDPLFTWLHFSGSIPGERMKEATVKPGCLGLAAHSWRWVAVFLCSCLFRVCGMHSQATPAALSPKSVALSTNVRTAQLAFGARLLHFSSLSAQV